MRIPYKVTGRYENNMRSTRVLAETEEEAITKGMKIINAQQTIGEKQKTTYKFYFTTYSL